MKCTVGYRTATQYWRQNRTAKPVAMADREQNAFLDQMLSCGESPGKKDALKIEQILGPRIKLPIIFCVFNNMRNRDTSSAGYRRCLEHLPKQSLVLLDKDTAISSPELTFIQYAADCCDLIQAIQFGFELCGSYRFDPESRDAFRGNAAAVTTPGKIMSVCDRSEQVRGIKRARRAAKYLLSNSASPMETILVLILCLPRHMGGSGFPKPKLNYRIRRKNESKDSSGRTHYYADLCWPEQKVCLEYDSDTFHLNSDQLAADSEKRTALKEMGWTTFSLTKQEIMNPAALEETIGIMAKSLNFRQRRKSEKEEEVRRALLDRLLHSFNLYE